MTQLPDQQPGEYYVSVIDGNRKALLLGPFTNNHQAAIDHIEIARELAYQFDPRSHWYAFGTCRLPGDDSVPIRAGKFNHLLSLQTRR